MAREASELQGGGVPDALVKEIESALGRIPGVTAARVVTAAGGRIAEVHVLAGRERAPKQVVRDVQSVVLASFGVEVDYRTVSVVQLDDALVEGDQASTLPRVALNRLSVDTAGAATEVRVQLTSRGQELLGGARGPASSGLRLIGRAVLDAVTQALAEAAVDIEYVDIVQAGSHPVAVAVLRMETTRGDQIVSGSAVVRKDANDAMARACLAALNRLLDQRQR